MLSESEVLKGRRALLFMQIFSTLGFSVLYGTLVLYATQGLKMSDKMATALTGSFLAFNYALHVLGGYVGGRLLSYRGLFIAGMLLQTIGTFFISVPRESSLVWGIAIFLTGAGLNVICINCMLTQLFKPEDKRRESAFLWNYSGMNVGFLIGFFVAGYFQLRQNFHTLFILAAFGSLISFSLALLNWKHLIDRGTSFAEADAKERKKRVVYAAIFMLGLCLALSWLLKHASFSNALIFILGIAVFGLWGVFAFRQKTVEESKKIAAFILLAACSLVFWTLYQMAPMGLSLFYSRNVEQTLFSIKIAPQWLMNVNSILIILGGPIMASVNSRLRKKGVKISLPFQFTTALFFIGIGFILLPLGIHFANPLGISSIWWVIGCYFFQSLGELFISPIGYAMVGQLIPVKLQSFAMGSWLMVTGVAAILASYFSQYALGGSSSLSPLKTNPSYAHAFLLLGCLAIAAACIVRALNRRLHKLIQEKEPTLKDVEPAPYNAPVD